MNKIAIIEDDIDICNMIAKFLENNKYIVHYALNGAEGIELCKSLVPDLIILDIMLPKLNGNDVLQRLRKFTNAPVIVVSAKTMVQTKIDLLKLGADDYMTKPFQPLELIARVKAQLRRYKRYNVQQKAKELSYLGLVMNQEQHICRLNEKDLNLTPIEFRLLWYLCERQGKVVSARELYTAIWQEEYLSSSNNTLMVHIRHIREKMKDRGEHPRYIQNVWGVGYKLGETL